MQIHFYNLKSNLEPNFKHLQVQFVYFQTAVFVFFDDFNFDIFLHCRDSCSYLPLTDTTKVEHSSNN